MKKLSVQDIALATSVVSVLVVGCRSNREPLEPPPVVAPALEFGTRHFVGSGLSGPTPERAIPSAVEPSDAYAVHCVLTYHEELPHFELPPLGTQARMIGAMNGETAILANPVFTTRVQYATADVAPPFMEQLDTEASDRSLMLRDFEGALLRGTSVVFAAKSEETLKLAIDTEAQRRVALTFSRDDHDDLQFVIAIDQLVKAEEDTTDPHAPDQMGPGLDPYLAEQDNRVLQREYLLLEQSPKLADGPSLILIPSPFPGDEGAGFSVLVKITEAPTAEPQASAHAEVVAGLIKALTAEHDAALESSRRLGLSELQDRQIAEALRNLRLDRLQRKTLVFLSTTTGASLAEDLVLIVADENLQTYAEAVITAAENSDALMDAEGGLGWVLERGAYQFLITALSEEQISSSHFGLLLKHAGEAGNFPAIIEDALAVSQNNAEFMSRIVEENRIFLEDHNIAARVRAYDWLDSLDQAPEGYDPLGESDARRAALSEDRRKREAAAQSAAGAKS